MVAQHPGEAPANPWKGRPVRAVPGSGYPMENVRLEPNADYAGDKDLVFSRGSCDFRTRLTPEDQGALLRLLYQVDPNLTIAFLIGMAAHLEADAQLLPCPADEDDQAVIERVIRLIQRHYLKMDV